MASLTSKLEAERSNQIDELIRHKRDGLIARLGAVEASRQMEDEQYQQRREHHAAKRMQVTARYEERDPVEERAVSFFGCLFISLTLSADC